MSNLPNEPSFIETEQLRDLLAEGNQVTIIDVRSPEEFAAGHIDGAINIPADRLATDLTNIPKDATIVTVCTLGGKRSCGAADQLKQLGFGNATPLRGGVHAWTDE